MFVRIVKLTLQEKCIEEFKSYFDKVKNIVRNQPGCSNLELYQDRSNPCIFFTYSYWEEESDLEQYRTSEVFGKIWPELKAFFSERAEAWSVDKLETLK
ncbi:putative quinol monooxygenase [Myroides injenensis]|uniref:putative quinol monooxygenase n=1 Tax=Myroides injenensis TaxID=1183151 RepID=UPI000289F0BC|nr:antibiotic biosynthesis monooxygenase family protein [Myroides injenensis]